MRLIDENEVVKAIDRHTFDTVDGLCIDKDITIILEEVPPAQPKKGKWEDLPFDDPYWYRCDQCGGKTYYIYAFCPYCGADMRGDEDE